MLKNYIGTTEELLMRSAKRRVIERKQTLHSGLKEDIKITAAYPGTVSARLKGWQTPWVFAEIDVSRLNSEALRPERVFLEQFFDDAEWRHDPESEAALWPASLEGVGVCTYQDDIPFDAIGRVALFRHTDNLRLAMAMTDANIGIKSFTHCGHVDKEIMRWIFDGEYESKRLTTAGSKDEMSIVGVGWAATFASRDAIQVFPTADAAVEFVLSVSSLEEKEND